MTMKTGPLVALAIAVPLLLTGTQTPARAQQGPVACPPGMQLVPPRTDGLGNAVAAYCAAAPTQGNYDPYAGANASDPQANRQDGAGQYIPRTR